MLWGSCASNPTHFVFCNPGTHHWAGDFHRRTLLLGPEPRCRIGCRMMNGRFLCRGKGLRLCTRQNIHPLPACCHRHIANQHQRSYLRNQVIPQFDKDCCTHHHSLCFYRRMSHPLLHRHAHCHKGHTRLSGSSDTHFRLCRMHCSHHRSGCSRRRIALGLTGCHRRIQGC